ncbi:MAG: hypothetical protein AAGD22_01990 [Verrucomicrobiota bacterium]
MDQEHFLHQKTQAQEKIEDTEERLLELDDLLAEIERLMESSTIGDPERKTLLERKAAVQNQRNTLSDHLSKLRLALARCTASLSEHPTDPSQGNDTKIEERDS